MMATCTKCLAVKDVSLFTKSSYVPSGHQSWCKACKTKLSAERQKTPEGKAKKAEINRKKWATSQEHREKRRLVQKVLYDKAKDLPGYMLRKSVQAGIRKSLAFGFVKKSRTFDILGYSQEDLRRHLEAQFYGGMTWKNYGSWHVDHITPLSELKPSTDAEIRAAWCLSNLRPLWAEENQRKHAKIEFLI